MWCSVLAEASLWCQREPALLQELKTEKTGTALCIVDFIYLAGFDDRLIQLSWSFILHCGGFAPFGYDKELFLPFLRDGCDAWKSCRVHFSS